MYKTELVREIDVLVSKKHWGEAETLCQTALSKYPNDLPITLRLVNALAKQQLYDKGVSISEALCQSYPNDVRALHALLDIYIAKERFQDAELAGKRWLGQEGNSDFFVQMRLGRFLNRQGKGKESVDWWAKLYKADADNTFVVEGYVDALVLTNDYEQIEKICNQWLKCNKDDVSIRLKFARLLTNRKNFLKALELWKKLSELEGSTSDIRIFHGLLDCLLPLKKLDDARLVCEEWRSRSPTEETIIIRSARVLMQCGLHEEAVNLLIGIQINNDQRIFSFLTECYLILDDIENVKTTAQQWLKAHSDNVEPKLHFTRALLILGEYKEAAVLLSNLENEQHSFSDSQTKLFVGCLLLSERLDEAQKIIIKSLAKAEVNRDWIRLLVQYAQHSRNASLSSLARALDILTFLGFDTKKVINATGILALKSKIDFYALSQLLADAYNKNSTNNEILNVFYSILARCQLDASEVTRCLKLFNKKTSRTNHYPNLYFKTCFNKSYKTKQTICPITSGVDLTSDGKRNSNKVVIALNGIGGGFGGFPLEFLDNYFKIRNITFVVLDDVTTRFYLSGVQSLGERFQDTVDYLAEEYKNHEFYFMGKSAGSLAAMHFAKALDAKSVICFGAAVNCTLEFFERQNDFRARPVVRRLSRLVHSELLDIKPSLDDGTSFKTFLWFGEENREDLVHAKYIEDIPKIYLRSIPGFKFHDALGGVVRANLLDDALTEFLA
tara:strand:+ start:45692 stop:47872 length:2181 start_codon:yes stop_codon:yes gene_type:complete